MEGAPRSSPSALEWLASSEETEGLFSSSPVLYKL